MYKVYGVQKGILKPHMVGSAVKKAARKMHPSSVKDFLTESPLNLSDDIRKEIISVLKEIREPMYLEEQEQSINPISKTFTKKGNFDQIANSYRGIQFLPKELQSVHNFMETKPSKLDKFHVKYDTTDQFGNNTTTIVKKLKEGDQFVYTAFTKYSNANKEAEPEQTEEPPASVTPGVNPPTSPTPSQPMQEQDVQPTTAPGQDDVVITKSAPFKDDTDGSEIMGDFLKKLDL